MSILIAQRVVQLKNQRQKTTNPLINQGVIAVLVYSIGI